MYDGNAQLQALIQLVNDLRRRLFKVEDVAAQAAMNVQMSPAGGGGGSGGATIVYVATPSGAIAAGGSTSASIYQVIGGSTVLVTTGTIWNAYTVATTAGKVLTLGANPDGSFLVLGQSC